jgi:transcriptional regulator with XRE-family HTH domain
VTKAVPFTPSLALSLAAQVKALRTLRGWTQAQLAEAAEMTSDEVSRIERGTREPRFITIERLAEALEVPPTRLFDGSADASARTDSKQQRYGGRAGLGVRRAAEKSVRLLQAALKDE